MKLDNMRRKTTMLFNLQDMFRLGTQAIISLNHIYINDLFISVSNSLICNYANDTTIYVSAYRNEEIIRKLENDTAILSE